MKSTIVWSLAALAVVLGACNRDRSRERERSGSATELKDPNEQDKSGTTTLTGASWVPNESAIDRIVASRCAREVTCSNVGLDKHFTSGEVCAREVRTKMHDELKASECPSGIDGKELDECLDAIRNESCTNPIESLGRLAACRTSDLCLRAEMPHR
jgi:hypothetical protein